MKEKFEKIADYLKTEKGYEIREFLLDGRWHSFRLEPNAKKKAGSYRVKNTPSGFEIRIKNFKDSSCDETIEIRNEEELTKEHVQELKKKIKEDNERENRKTSMRQETVANEAWARFQLGRENPDNHPYLKRKDLKASYGAREYLGSLKIPMRDIQGKFWGYESIAANGEKETLRGARKQGCFHSLGGEIDPQKTLYIAEGFATAATIYEITNQNVLCTFGHNFKAVACDFRIKYPELKIVILGDADSHGAGLKAARSAAYASKALYKIPEFRTPAPNYTDFNDLKALEGEGTVRMQLEEEKKVYRTKDEKQVYIDEWVQRHSFTVTYNGKIRYQMEREEEESDFEDLLDQVYLDGRNEGIELPERVIKAFLRTWKKIEQRKEFERIRKPLLEYHPNQELDRLMIALIRKPSHLDYSVMKHFIWQVKRKLARKPVEHHMMPVIRGTHKSGKTTTIRLLLKPLEELWMEPDFSVIDDEKKYVTLNRKYVIFFDEMAKAEKTDLNKIKRIISGEDINFRKLYTHDNEEKRMNATFIATTNSYLEYLIKDIHTMRRFYELTSLDRANFDEINSIDFLKIWQGVSEDEPCPVLPEIDKGIDEHQEKSRHLTDIETWTKEIGLQKSKTNSISLAMLLLKYSDFARKKGLHLFEGEENQWFAKELRRMGYESTRHSCGVIFKVLIANAAY